MKVLLLSRYCPDNIKVRGGPMLIAKNLYEALEKNGHSVNLLSPRQFYGENKLLIMLKIIAFMIRHRGEYDIVNVDSGSDILPLALIALKNLVKCPIVLTLHGYPRFSSVKVIGDRHVRCTDIMIKSYKNIIVVSKLLKRAITEDRRRFHKNFNDITTIHNGINQVFLDRPRCVSNTEYPGMTLLLVGGLDENKGIWFLLNALREIDDINWRLYVIGTSDYDLEKYDGLIRGYKMGHKIKWIGRVHPKDIIKYYDSNDILVAPGRFDSFNVSILEGMARGMPVITTHTSGASEIIENYKSGIVVDFGNIPALMDAIRFLKKKDNRNYIGGNARKKTEKYGWLEVSKQYVTAYQKFIDNHNRGKI